VPRVACCRCRSATPAVRPGLLLLSLRSSLASLPRCFAGTIGLIHSILNSAEVLQLDESKFFAKFLKVSARKTRSVFIRAVSDFRFWLSVLVCLLLTARFGAGVGMYLLLESMYAVLANQRTSCLIVLVLPRTQETKDMTSAERAVALEKNTDIEVSFEFPCCRAHSDSSSPMDVLVCLRAVSLRSVSSAASFTSLRARCRCNTRRWRRTAKPNRASKAVRLLMLECTDLAHLRVPPALQPLTTTCVSRCSRAISRPVLLQGISFNVCVVARRLQLFRARERRSVGARRPQKDADLPRACRCVLVLNVACRAWCMLCARCMLFVICSLVLATRAQGKTTQEKLLSDAVKVISEVHLQRSQCAAVRSCAVFVSQFMKRDPKDVRFNIVALAQNMDAFD
jgi:hypothetical protein